MLILFDIDGTLIAHKNDTSKKVILKIIAELFNKTLKSYDLPDFSGMTDSLIFHEIFPKLGLADSNYLEARTDFWNMMSNEMKKHYNEDNFSLLGGVKEILEAVGELDFYKGVLTGNIKSEAHSKLATFGILEGLETGAFGDDAISRNDLAEIAMSRLSLKYQRRFEISKTLIIGDSPRDIECAKLNGMKSLAVATGSYSIDALSSHKPDAVLESMNNVKETLKIIEQLVR